MGHAEDSVGTTAAFIIADKNDVRKIGSGILLYVKCATCFILHILRSACRNLKFLISVVNSFKIFLHKDTAFLPELLEKEP